MTHTESIEIPLSKKKMALGLIGSLAFVGIGFWFVISPPKGNHWLLANPTFVLVAGLASIIVFGIFTVIIAKKLPDNQAGLIINAEGILDNSSAVSVGLILWKDIQEIYLSEIMNQKLLLVILENPQDYIDKQPNSLKRKLMEMNLNSYGSPISISANALQTNIETLYELLQKRLNQYKS